MPLYEFLCESCGTFEERRSLSAAGDPAHCPGCQIEAQRIFSPPGLYRTSATARRVRERAEAGVEPQVEQRSSPAEPAPLQPQHSHGRPWMLGH